MNVCLGFLGFWDFWEKGFHLETPKKYTFALVEEKWVLFCMDFSKIAVLFFMYFDFCNKKIVDFGGFFEHQSIIVIFDSRAPFGGTIAGAKRRHGSQICYKKYIHKI